MATNIFRRPRHPPGGVATDLSAKAFSQADRISDRLTIPALRKTLLRVHRTIGLTRSGYIALVGAVGLWIVARVVAGTAMYVAAYGAVGFVIVAVFLAPRRLGLTADRSGLFPRTTEGQVLDVKISLVAK